MKESQNVLRKARWTDVFWRGLYEAQVEGGSYIVEIDYFDIRERIALYRDGVLADMQKSPATFLLPGGGKIEIAMALYGVKYARVILGDQGDEEAHPLIPVPGSAEHLRLRFAEQHPTISRILAGLAWIVLVVALVTQLPVVLNSIGYLIGFSVPTFALPGWVNTALGVSGILAALDRAFRMKYDPLLDG